jgi:hypothetical protein
MITVKYANVRKEPFQINEPEIPLGLSPWFVVGYCDAEACFDINIKKSNTCKTGFSIITRFRIVCNKRDIVLLHMIKAFFNCGKIGKIDSKDCLEFAVSDHNSLVNIIIPFFNKYTLKGTKLLDYLDWTKCLEVIKNKEHLSIEGLNKIRLIKESLNTGRVIYNNMLEKALLRLSSNNLQPEYKNLDPNYVSGFLVGDGYLSLISKIDSPSFGRIRVGLTQHKDNYLLLQTIKDFFNLDKFVIRKTNKEMISLNCGSQSVVINNLLPFFKSYPIYGVKAITLNKLFKILDLINKSREELDRKTIKWTPELKNQILSIWNDSNYSLKGDATIFEIKVD